MTRKVAVVVVLSIISLAISLVWLQSSKLPAGWLTEDGYLSSDKVREVTLALRAGERPKDMLQSSVVADELIDVVLLGVEPSANVDELGPNEKNQLLAAKLLAEIQVASLLHINLSSYSASDEAMNDLQAGLIPLVNRIQKDQKVTAFKADVLAELLLPVALGTQDERLSKKNIIKIYQILSKQKSPHGNLHAALLHLLWLKSQGGDISKSLDNIYVLEKIISSQGDLIRSLNYHQRNIVLGSLKLIKELVPKNAIHALKYHLISNKNEKIQLAALEAIALYGVAARPYNQQLKSLLYLTKSDNLKNKIQAVLKKINGL